MGKSIAIFNQKGGVGKTTTNINLAACLAKKGKKVLILDIDPQGNTTSGIGVAKRNLKNTVYNILIDKNYDPRKAIIHTTTENLDLIPASVDLAGAEVELVQIEEREKTLKIGLDKVRDDYDYIFIDCPPSLGLLTINSLTAVDSVLIPIQCEFYALEGVSQLVSTIELVKKSLNPKLEIQGVILSMFDGRTNLSVAVVQEVKKYFGDKALSIFIKAPSVGVLRERLVKRGTDSPEAIEERVAKAEEEMTYAPKFDYVLVNDDLNTAYAESEKVVEDFLDDGRLNYSTFI